MTDNYSSYIDQLIGSLAQAHALGRDIDLATCVSGLEPDEPENRRVREYAIRSLKIPAIEFDRAMHSARIKAELGVMPKTAREFIESYVASRHITVRYNGVLRARELPYLLRPDGSKDFISPTLWEHDDFKTLIRSKFHRALGFAEFQQALRVRAAELHLRFPAAIINDASELWYHETCRDRLWQIMGELAYSDDPAIQAEGLHSLLQLAETCFVCANRIEAEMVVAAFQKFIWQVKRKVDDLPIYDHLMPVISGPQRTGKSTLVRHLLKPIDELWAMGDFRLITDDRHITIWRNFVIFMDEMGWAKRADIDTVKNAITAMTISRRPMRTNLTQEVMQNATFIGTANISEINELIRDSTGLRRFVNLRMRSKPDWALINAINWQSVWRSVNHRADDPMAPYQAVLAAHQEAERAKTPVEDWADTVELKYSDQLYRSSELYVAFQEFENCCYPGKIKTTMPIFIREMKRLAQREQSRFRLAEDDGYKLWSWSK